jgi:hypothetical protein
LREIIGRPTDTADAERVSAALQLFAASMPLFRREAARLKKNQPAYQCAHATKKRDKATNNHAN